MFNLIKNSINYIIDRERVKYNTSAILVRQNLSHNNKENTYIKFVFIL
jgi:hypothetical protein